MSREVPDVSERPGCLTVLKNLTDPRFWVELYLDLFASDLVERHGYEGALRIIEEHQVQHPGWWNDRSF